MFSDRHEHAGSAPVRRLDSPSFTIVSAHRVLTPTEPILRFASPNTFPNTLQPFSSMRTPGLEQAAARIIAVHAPGPHDDLESPR
jgi:hypothetical protein